MNKWTIYAVTFLTYSLIHSIRTCWASLKLSLQKQPFFFSQEYLGVLDMIVLFTLAISLNVFGHKVQKYSCRTLLFPTLIVLILNLICLYIGLQLNVTSKVFYLVFYGSVGVVSCLAWPICLYTMSQYFKGDHPTAISMWNSVSQFGDAIAFLLTIIVVNGFQVKPFNTLIILACLLTLMTAINLKLFEEKKKEPQKMQIIQLQSNNEEKVNFCNVWKIPGVALPVLAFSMIKSINAIIIAWLVLYLDKIRMVKQSQTLAILWACGIVIGGFLGSLFNKNLSYAKFCASLFLASILFFFLDEMHRRPQQFQVLVLIVLAGILVGGPYNQMGTAVPLKLGQRPDIKARPGAKAQIISLMESCGQIMCGFAVLIVPSIGVLSLHIMGLTLCMISVVLLLSQLLRLRFEFKQSPNPDLVEMNDVKEEKSDEHKQNCGPAQQQKQNI